MSTILEVGARDAADSLRLKKIYPNATVYAFEAHDEEYERYKDDESLSAINYYNIGIWSENTTLDFHEKGVGPHTRGISSFRDRGQMYGTHTTQKDVISIESFCKDNEVSSLDVVLGFGDMLNAVKVLHIETEREEHFEGQHLEGEVFEFLRQKGFVLEKHSHCCLTQYDSIWIRK